MKYKVGDKVIGKNFFGKGRLNLVITEDKGNGFYQCAVEGTDVSMPYREDELKLR